jgi:epoxyqueuosine reductase
MIDEKTERLSRAVIAQAKVFGADLAGIVGVKDLKRSPSHRISGRMPEFDGVGTKSVEGRRRGIVHWPDGAAAAVVIAIEHPSGNPELDWWVTGASAGNTPGNALLMAVIEKLAGWLERKMGIRSYQLPYHIEHGAIYMKDAAVLAGLGCIGKNNLLITPQYGPRQRLRVMLVDADLPATGPLDFDPCINCSLPCRRVCPQNAFAQIVYPAQEYGMGELPGRSGVYSRFHCNLQMDRDNAGFERVAIEGRTELGKRVRYCRECELACPVGRP